MTSFSTVVLFVVGAIGPLVSAIVLTAQGGEPRARRALLRSAIGLREIPARWWALIVTVALAPNLIGLLLDAAVSGTSPDFDELAELGETPQAYVFILAFAVAAGFAEEPGWRGYALERLRQRHTLLTASLVIGVLWGVWHFPLYFIEETFQADKGFGSGAFWYLSLSILALSVLYTWIRQGAGWLSLRRWRFTPLATRAGSTCRGRRAVDRLRRPRAFASAVAARWRRAGRGPPVSR